jgi:N utilization substance protein B
VKVRRQARAIALQALFEVDSVNHPIDMVFDYLVKNDNLVEDGALFSRRLVDGVLKYREQLDITIAQHAPDYPVGQLAIIDRNILRMALYELQHMDDVPIKVAINEAIELAKMFGSDTAPRFVNGVLGAYLQRHPAAELRPS